MGTSKRDRAKKYKSRVRQKRHALDVIVHKCDKVDTSKLSPEESQAVEKLRAETIAEREAYSKI